MAWPAVALILGIIALILFRRELRKVIGKIKKAGKEGIETHPDIPEQTASGIQGRAEDIFREYFDSPVLRDQEREVLADLEKRNILDPAEREKVLLRAVALAMTTANFERAFSSMWSSQFECLTYLNQRPGGCTVTEIGSFYEKGKANYPSYYHDRPIEVWLSYLQSHNLITRADNRISISRVGQEFLKFVIGTQKVLPANG